MSTNSSFRLLLAPAALSALLLACGGDETQNTEDHTPETFTVIIDGTPVEPPFTLTFGETVRMRIQFFNADEENLDAVEASHFAGLTFDPSSMATATRLADHNYQFDVTANTVGSGTVVVSFGHSEDADEVEFPALPISVIVSNGGGQ